MTPRAFPIATLIVLHTGCALAWQEPALVRFQRDVAWLADDARQGRQTGSPELAATAEYVAARFDELGLVPGGDDGGWLQHFSAAGSRVLIDGNTLSLAGETLTLHTDWEPFSSSAPGQLIGPLVFAGYGISDPEGGYDDYAGLEVTGKVVVVLRRGPGAGRFPPDAAGGAANSDADDEAEHGQESGDAHAGAQGPTGSEPHAGAQARGDGHPAAAHGAGDPHGGAAPSGHGAGSPAHGHGGSPAGTTDRARRYLDLTGKGRHHIEFGSKINTAYRHGAAAVIIVNDPASHPPGSAADAVVPFGSSRVGSVSASLPAVHVTAAAAARALAGLGLDLGALQRSVDEAMSPRSFGLPEGNAALVVATEREQVGTVNVVGILPGHDEDRADEHVLIGAHMDHLGLGLRSGSMGGPADAGQIHNGADDNASGTAGLLAAAELLSDRRRSLARSVVFVAFGAEEWGLLGSRHYVANPVHPLEHMLGMVNMDMIGRSEDGDVSVTGVGTAADDRLLRLVDAAREELSSPLEVQTAPGVPANSDHQPFFEKRIPVLNFFTGLHDDYHRPGDDVDKVDSENGVLIAELAAECVWSLARLEQPLVFADPEAGKQVAQAADPHGDGEQAEVVGYRVVFGSQPDMTYQADDGVRISGTRAGTPAERCGLLEGDVIVAFDGKPVRNLEDYSVLLFSRRPGDEIKVTVRRGEEQIELKAVLEGQRGDS